MRNFVAVLLALLWSGAVVSDPVTARFKADVECPTFTPVENQDHPTMVHINLTELECLGVVFKDLKPWETFSHLDSNYNKHQHIPLNKQALGFILHLAKTLRSKSYNKNVPIVLTIDSIPLIDSGGVEVVITKDPGDPEDWRLRLQKPRNQDVLWQLTYYQASNAVLLVDDDPDLFRVIVRRHPDFLKTYNDTFHQTVLTAASK